MIWVGLTGGIASGKSTVSAIFHEAGAFIVDADQIAHRMLQKGELAYHAVLDAFSARILDSEGEIDRKRLGEIIFRSAEKRLLLNKIVHPFVFEIADQEREKILLSHPDAVIIFDAPLLIETNAHLKMDLVFLVYVDETTQIERLCKRDNISKEAALSRIGSQMSLESKRSFANEVIDNNGSPEETRETVLKIYQMLCTASRPR